MLFFRRWAYKQIPGEISFQCYSTPKIENKHEEVHAGPRCKIACVLSSQSSAFCTKTKIQTSPSHEEHLRRKKNHGKTIIVYLSALVIAVAFLRRPSQADRSALHGGCRGLERRLSHTASLFEARNCTPMASLAAVGVFRSAPAASTLQDGEPASGQQRRLRLATPRPGGLRAVAPRLWPRVAAGDHRSGTDRTARAALCPLQASSSSRYWPPWPCTHASPALATVLRPTSATSRRGRQPQRDSELAAGDGGVVYPGCGSWLGPGMRRRWLCPVRPNRQRRLRYDRGTRRRPAQSESPSPAASRPGRGTGWMGNRLLEDNLPGKG
ncbi:unnamed protein product [Miscanthus lutarioriparius]|uniref:Uncharacterized protein n=1 Tax=Miscanthus lutarioriparius TaxID=422564 RepID=A0A811MVG7_9POAL|nr:unnamed protein product [Miscanthus lutarioriparius]